MTNIVVFPLLLVYEKVSIEIDRLPTKVQALYFVLGITTESASLLNVLSIDDVSAIACTYIIHIFNSTVRI